jgi:hypothetical protein
MVIILLAIVDYSINGYYWLFYWRPSVVILLVVINGYSFGVY